MTHDASVDPRRRCLSSSSSSNPLSSMDVGEHDQPEQSPGAAGLSARSLRRRIDETDGRRRTSMSTRLSHAGLPSQSGRVDDDDDDSDSDNDNAPLCPPIELATTYERPSHGDYGRNGRVYARSCNPTRKLLEDVMGELEMMFLLPRPRPRRRRGRHADASAAAADDATTSTARDATYADDRDVATIVAPTFAFSSGMAAVASLLLSCESPTRVILPNDVYHGVPTQLVTSLVGRNVSYESTDMTNVDDVRRTVELNVARMLDDDYDNDDGGGRGRGGDILLASRIRAKGLDGANTKR